MVRTIVAVIVGILAMASMAFLGAGSQSTPLTFAVSVAIGYVATWIGRSLNPAKVLAVLVFALGLAAAAALLVAGLEPPWYTFMVPLLDSACVLGGGVLRLRVQRHSSFVGEPAMRQPKIEAAAEEGASAALADGWRHLKYPVVPAICGSVLILLAYFPVGQFALALTAGTLVMGVGLIFGYFFLAAISVLEIVLAVFTVRAGSKALRATDKPARAARQTGGPTWIIIAAFILTAINTLLTLYLWPWFWEQIDRMMKA